MPPAAIIAPGTAVIATSASCRLSVTICAVTTTSSSCLEGCAAAVPATQAASGAMATLHVTGLAARVIVVPPRPATLFALAGTLFRLPAAEYATAARARAASLLIAHFDAVHVNSMKETVAPQATSRRRPARSRQRVYCATDERDRVDQVRGPGGTPRVLRRMRYTCSQAVMYSPLPSGSPNATFVAQICGRGSSFDTGSK